MEDLDNYSPHRLLARQLRRHLQQDHRGAPELQSFLRSVDDAYVAADEDRTMLERSLEESSHELYVANSELRAIFQTLPDCLLTLDLEGMILDAKGGRLEAEVDIRELAGSSLASCLAFDDPTELARAIEGVCQTMRASDGALEATALGSSSEFDVRVMPLSRGTVLAIVTEVSERRRHERELRAARDAAEAAACVKSEFLATMSHEIRTPLNGVIGMTGVLMGTDLDEDQREYLRIANSSGEALLTLINDILDFSKIEAECLELELSTFSPADLVEETLELLSEAAGRKRLELCAIIDDDVPSSVEGDPGRLRQVLINLTGNAIKFTETGSVTLRLQARSNDLAAWLGFSVTDTGIGIAEESLGKLFEPFTQADSSTTRRFGGTGLGLAICDRLVTLMGGTIECESALHRGSCFRFDVPNRAVDGVVPTSVPPWGLSELSVLCVDDSDASRIALEHQLRPHVARVDSVASGPVALKMAEDWRDGCPYDAWIIDMDMPELDGAELTRRIREAVWGRDVPILMLSSADNSSALSRAREAGVDAILRKPARRSLLLSRIAKLTSEPSDCEGPTVVKLGVSPAREERVPRILVAEDNPTNQRVAQVMLKRLGCRPHVVGNGIEALDAMEQAGYDAVFMDCQMPELDGFEATRLLRAREGAGSRTLIIALTASAQAEVREQCFEAGMDGYLSKPVRLEDLRELLVERGILGERLAVGGAPVDLTPRN